MKNLAVVNLGAHGHVNPTLAVVKELAKMQVEVRQAGGQARAAEAILATL